MLSLLSILLQLVNLGIKFGLLLIFRLFGWSSLLLYLLINLLDLFLLLLNYWIFQFIGWTIFTMSGQLGQALWCLLDGGGF